MRRADLSHVEAWFFDLDNTLYPAHSDLFSQIDQRMAEFIARFLEVDHVTARRYQKGYWESHGTTLSGMMAEHGMAAEPFLDYVHDIDVSVLSADPHLDAALERLPGQKIVFTNGSLKHAQRVLEQLRLAHHFEDIFDIAAAEFVPKPQPDPYRKLLAQTRARAQTVAMFEDSAKNLLPAHALGMTTVWVRGKSEWSGPDAHHTAKHIHHHTDELTGFLNTALLRQRPDDQA